jgi:hypothetical protein
MAKSTKKVLKKQPHDHHVRHRVIIGSGVVVIALLLGLVFSLIIIPKITDDVRLQRINDIYSSIKLPQNIYFETDNIFGDKRPYSYDPSRSEASSKTFVVAKDVTDTFNTMDTAIKAAGYTEFEVAYPDSTSKEYHYKTNRGEYIRLNVSSKYRNDVASDEELMTGTLPPSFYQIDTNAGPSTVTLKVNLDDDNE